MIDVGNTNVVYALFRGKKKLRQWRLPTAPWRLPTINKPVEQIIIASVVPKLNQPLQRQLSAKFGLPPHFVTAANIPQLKIRLKNKSEIGADRVVDALAAWQLYGGPAIVIDFGTATTLDVVSARGEYVGGVIAPGLMMARDALHTKTAKLPKISIKSPIRVIGNSTKQAMRSGLVIGYAAMIEGLVQRIQSALKIPRSKLKVIATGGLARLICQQTAIIDTIDQDLTLKGLQLIGEKYER